MTRYLLIVFFAALGMIAADAQSATGAAKKQAGQRGAQTAKSAKAKVPAKQPPRSVPKAASGSAKKSAGKATTSKVRGSTRQAVRAPPESVTPPAGDVAVPIAPTRPAKPIMNRMYALDGDTFYHNGKKIRVRGLEAAHDSDLAKQRLQRALDSGEVAIEPIGTRDSGEIEAAVRINGRDLTEMLRVEAPEAAPLRGEAEPAQTETEGSTRQ